MSVPRGPSSASTTKNAVVFLPKKGAAPEMLGKHHGPRAPLSLTALTRQTTPRPRTRPNHSTPLSSRRRTEPGLARLHAQATGADGETMLNTTAALSNGAAPAATARISLTQRRALERQTLLTLTRPNHQTPRPLSAPDLQAGTLNGRVRKPMLIVLT